jgi:DNA-binding NarL/FixJ family response regulator
MPGRSAETGSPQALTRRELEIPNLIAEGLTSQQIAARLFISERTVTTHVTNMLNKLGLSSRIQLATWVASRDVG